MNSIWFMDDLCVPNCYPAFISLRITVRGIRAKTNKKKGETISLKNTLSDTYISHSPPPDLHSISPLPFPLML